MKTSIRAQKGFSIFDISVGLAIIGILLGTIFGLTQLLQDRGEINNAQTQHQALYTGVQSMYAADPTYTGVNNERVLQSQTAVPKKMRGTGTENIKHTWSQDGQGVVIAATNGGQTFAITYTNIPGDVCVEFTNAIRESTLNTTINSVAVNDGNDVADNCDASIDTNTIVAEYN